MSKIKIGVKNYLYPVPTILAGTMVNCRPNYLNVSFGGIANRGPAMIYISLNKLHYSCIGIRENKTFSVNIPSVDMIDKTDYCGMVSGKEIDKSKLFNTFYGELANAPMIEECPINIECRVVHELELEGSNVVFIGRIIETYTEEKYMTNNLPDIEKINPLLLSLNDFNYFSIGTKVGKGWNEGKKIKNLFPFS